MLPHHFETFEYCYDFVFLSAIVNRLTAIFLPDERRHQQTFGIAKANFSQVHRHSWRQKN